MLTSWKPDLPGCVFLIVMPSDLSITFSPQINCAQATEIAVPFGGYKQSGIGSDLGQYALDTFVLYRCRVQRGTEISDRYTQVKSVHVNIGMKL